MIHNYFITALRNLWRNKVFSAINITGLSVGIACCMLIFLYTKDEVSFDRFHKRSADIYRITADNVSEKGNVSKYSNTGMLQGPAFKAQDADVEAFVRLEATQFNVKKGKEVFEQKALFTDENFFSVFSFPLLYGNPATALNDLHAVVISEALADKYFGSTNVVGKILELNTGQKFEPFVVSAVTKNSPQNSSIRAEMLVPMKFRQTQEDDKQWMNFYLNTFVLLKPGTNIKNTETTFNRIYNAEAAPQIKEMADLYGVKDKIVYGLQPLLQMHLSTGYIADNGLVNASNPMYSYILTGITLFILLIACINFINLTVARSVKRAKEIGIRKVVGGQRKQLVLQFLGESFILSFFAFALAIVLTLTALPFFNAVSNKALSFSYLYDIKLVSGYAALFFITGLLAGFYPALVLSRFNPVETLYGKFRFTGKNYLSKGMIVFQFTLSTFLIIATIVIYSQFNYLVNYDVGYDAGNVMRINTAALSSEKFDVLKQELLKDQTIKAVTAKQPGRMITMAHVNGIDKEFDFANIDEDYFSLFKIPILKGRHFSKKISSDSTSAVIINESFAKSAGWKDPVGQVVDFYYKKKKYNVIGVVRDYHFAALTEKMTSQLFTATPTRKHGLVYVKINPGQKPQAMRHIEKVCKQLYPMQPYQYRFEDEVLIEAYAAEQKWKQIITFSAMLTIFISCIGLFGLAALSGEKRAKEIGIRKVLGASISGIVKNVSLDFLKLVLVAALMAIPAAWWAMNKWLENYPYHVELRISLFVFAVATVLLVALLTIVYQAAKAAMADPVKSLRTE